MNEEIHEAPTKRNSWRDVPLIDLAIAVTERLPELADDSLRFIEAALQAETARREAARELARSHEGKGMKVKGLVIRAASKFGVSQAEIMGRTRGTKAAVSARQWVMLRAYEEGYSMPQIGRELGRDHTTVLEGIRRQRERERQAGA